jgi:hypothetical protein
MVGAIKGLGSKIVGLHRTYLSIQPDGLVRKLALVEPDGDPFAAKQMLGKAMAGRSQGFETPPRGRTWPFVRAQQFLARKFAA